MRPQFITCGSISGREIDGVANEVLHVSPRVPISTTGYISYEPCRMIGGIMRPQLMSSASTIG